MAMIEIYTSRINHLDERQPYEFVGTFEGSEYEAVAFCFKNWPDYKSGKACESDIPPFEIKRADGSWIDWDKALGLDVERVEKAKRAQAKKDRAVKLDESVSCQRCQSHRVASAGGKCSDLGYFTMGSIDHDGYVPDEVGIGGGDYVEITYCLDCGQLKGKWPLETSPIERGVSDDDDEDDD
jgi:hypothetical protein